jgi:hypothetical protein
MKRSNGKRTGLALAVLMLCAGTTASAQCAAGNENAWVAPSTPSAEFIDLGDGMLLHEPTRLVWLRCPLGQSWDGAACTGSPDRMTWADALVAADAHLQLKVDDWRLPNRNELASIVEARCYLPAVNAAAFPDTPAEGFWSSSPVTDAVGQRWLLDFADGAVEAGDAAGLNAVRLVRAGRR